MNISTCLQVGACLSVYLCTVFVCALCAAGAEGREQSVGANMRIRIIRAGRAAKIPKLASKGVLHDQVPKRR